MWLDGPNEKKVVRGTGAVKQGADAGLASSSHRWLLARSWRTICPDEILG